MVRTVEEMGRRRNSVVVAAGASPAASPAGDGGVPAEKEIGVRAAARALAVLRLLGEHPYGGECTLDEISRNLALPKSTTHRILATLKREGFVDSTDGASYRLGIEAAIIGSSAIQHQRPRYEVRELMARAASEIGETVGLGVLNGRRVLVVERGVPPRPFSWNIGVGSTLPAHASAAGKILLSGLDEGSVAALFPADGVLEPSGPHTITTRDALFAELELTRQRGYALDCEEFEEGLHCVAVPVRSLDESITHSLGITAPVSRVNEQLLVDIAALLAGLAGELARYFLHEQVLQAL
jgi:DNA-binding IclR family transcriptional regulator